MPEREPDGYNQGILRLRILPWLLALAAVLVVAVFLYVSGRAYVASHAAVRETLAARSAMAETLSLLKDAETGGRGFMLTGDEKFLEPYENARPLLQSNLATLAEIGKSDVSQREAVRRVDLLVHQKLDLLRDMIARRREGTLLGENAVPVMRQGKDVMDAIRVEMAEMLARADVRLAQRERGTASATLQLELVLAAGFLGAVGLALAGYSAARKDVKQARLTSEQLAGDVAARKQAEHALRDQTSLLESVLENIGDGVVVINQDRKMLIVNSAGRRILPYVPGDVASAKWAHRTQTYLPDGETFFPADEGPLTRAMQGHASDGVEMKIRIPSGELRSYSVTTRPMVTDAGTVGAVAVYRDTTDMTLAEKDLVESQQRYRVLAEATFEGVAITSAGRILDTNANFAQWLGFEPHELLGMPGVDLIAPEERDRLAALAQGDALGYESAMIRRDGTTFPVEVRSRSAEFRGKQVRIAVIRDITERREHEAQLLEKSEQLRALSLRDELTGLYNRRGFIELGEHRLKAAERAGRSCAVFFADLNGMKLINDGLGHEVGDHAIRTAARCLVKVFRASDIVSRLGGDEFAVFAPDCDELGVTAACVRLEREIGEVNGASSSRYRLSISTGAAIWTKEAPRDLFTLMQTADANMYQVKRARHERGSLRVK